MALQECGLNTNRANKELKPHGTADFPCAGYESEHTTSPETAITWHWHEELEIIYIVDGCMLLQVPMQTFALKAGELAILNANILHYAQGKPYCKMRSIVFSPLLICGETGSVFYKKYLSPLLSCPDFICIQKDRMDVCAKHFATAFDALKNDTQFFEFTVRSELSKILQSVYSDFQGRLRQEVSSSGADSERMKAMLDYIHRSYPTNIQLSDICAAANIGEREALRCFRRSIGQSPIQYLIKYRLTQSAALLLSTAKQDIAQIAGLCGFSSTSYYAKKFKELYLCTPSEYQRRVVSSTPPERNISRR